MAEHMLTDWVNALAPEQRARYEELSAEMRRAFPWLDEDAFDRVPSSETFAAILAADENPERLALTWEGR